MMGTIKKDHRMTNRRGLLPWCTRLYNYALMNMSCCGGGRDLDR